MHHPRVLTGRNYEVLQDEPGSFADLVYCDPPYNSQKFYNLTVGNSTAQEQAYLDYYTWTPFTIDLWAQLQANQEKTEEGSDVP